MIFQRWSGREKSSCRTGGLVKVIKDPAKSGRGNIYKIERVSPVENDTGKNLDSIRAFMEEASPPVGKDVFLTHEDMNRVIADGLPNEIRENRDVAYTDKYRREGASYFPSRVWYKRQENCFILVWDLLTANR